MQHHRFQSSTSWQRVSRWYNERQGNKGSYFYEKIILPKTLKLLGLKPESTLLDLGCGQGILERRIPKETTYIGVDLAKDLLEFARKNSQTRKHEFHLGDITKPLPFLAKRQFSRLAVILALQNVEDLGGLFRNIGEHLAANGLAVIVINHPYYRIPRQSSWEVDEQNKLQYRRINRYQTAFKIPIDMTPGGRAAHRLTWSFHYPLWQISEEANRHKLFLTKVEEWTSDKTSVGKAHKMENFSREEFPLFMTLVFTKR